MFLTGVISKAIYKSSEEDKKEEEVKKTLEQHDNIVTQYKKVIREQVRGSYAVHVPPGIGWFGFQRHQCSLIPRVPNEVTRKLALQKHFYKHLNQVLVQMKYQCLE